MRYTGFGFLGTGLCHLKRRKNSYFIDVDLPLTLVPVDRGLGSKRSYIYR